MTKTLHIKFKANVIRHFLKLKSYYVFEKDFHIQASCSTPHFMKHSKVVKKILPVPHEFKLTESNSYSEFSSLCYIPFRGIKKKAPHDENSLSHLFAPVTYKRSEFEQNVGEDIVGPIRKSDIVSVISKFYTDPEVKELAAEQGLDQYLFQQTTISFRKLCIEAETLPTDLHIVLSDIINGGNHIHDLYPYFYKHAKDIFPHLDCMDDLYKVSDLTQPTNWYPDARAMYRKIIFHAGPTNSGKTYHAMEQFLSSSSGVYCGPLKLLAVEVFQKANDKGTLCDLVTGEERKYADSEDSPANHVACTVEMASVNTKYDIAIVDEIQMVKDPQRGWAWTRAFMGLCASEVHVCGEAAAIDIIKELALAMGEDVEVRKYKRLTALKVEDTALLSLDNVIPGDCIVCFGRQHIHSLSQALERMGHDVAVIYGGLPPGAKLAQAKKFNDPNNPCKIMIATDAIGMGLNLSIRRVIFHSLVKHQTNEKGERELVTVSVSSALQIAGRAGRYGTAFNEGYVTTFKSEDLPVLRNLLDQAPQDIEQAGLHPTADQIEIFAFHLPTYTLSNLVDIFTKLCTLDTLYFMCLMDDFKFLADLIQHISLTLKARYVFCCAPINKKMPFVCAIFLKFARQYSQNEPVTLDWICRQVKWPFSTPKTIQELVHLEEMFDVFDLYLWLSYRFPDMFPDSEMVRNLQRELDELIQQGVSHITQLLRNSSSVPSNIDEELVKPSKPSLKTLESNQATRTSRTARTTIPELEDISRPAAIKNRPTYAYQSNEVEEKLTGDKESDNDYYDDEDDDDDGGKSLSVSQYKPKRGRLTERLIKKGIISPKMLEEIKQEWKESEMMNDASSPRKKKQKHLDTFDHRRKRKPRY